MRDGEELVEEPFERLIQEKQLVAYKYQGYWTCMDTFKDRQLLEEIYNQGNAPWEVWKPSKTNGGANGKPAANAHRRASTRPPNPDASSKSAMHTERL
jgi:NDP-sugar pyrophosphorylase family protein